MRQTEYGRFLHAFDLVQLVFDFFWINIETPADDQVFAPADDGKVALLVTACQITGDEKSIFTKFLLGFLRKFPVTLKNIGTFDFQGADFPILEFFPGLITNSDRRPSTSSFPDIRLMCRTNP